MMKNAVLITLLLSGMTFSALAQERGRRAPKSAEEIAQMRTDRLTEELTLSEKQQRAVYELSLEDAKKMQAARKDRRAQAEKERTSLMNEHREAMKASQERLNKILTGEQREILKQQQAERVEKMKSMRDRRGNGKFRGERTRRGKRDVHRKSDSTNAPEAPLEETE